MDEETQMAEFFAAVYDPPGPHMPHLAVVVSNGEVTVAIAVSSVEEGEARIQTALAGLKKLADEHQAKSGRNA